MDKKAPTASDLANIESDSHIRTQEATQDFNPTDMVKLHEFGDKVLEDGAWAIFFTPSLLTYTQDGKVVEIKNSRYSPIYLPLYLFFGRACRLGNMNSNDIVRWRGEVHRAAQRCYTLANMITDPQEQRLHGFVIESMEKYLNTVIPTHANGGFFLKTLFEQRKTLSLLSNKGEEKKGWKFF